MANNSNLQEQLKAQLDHVEVGNFIPYKDKNNGIEDTKAQLKQEQLKTQLDHVEAGNFIPYKDKNNGIADTKEQLRAAGVKLTPDGESQRQAPVKPQAEERQR